MRSYSFVGMSGKMLCKFPCLWDFAPVSDTFWCKNLAVAKNVALKCLFYVYLQVMQRSIPSTYIEATNHSLFLAVAKNKIFYILLKNPQKGIEGDFHSSSYISSSRPQSDKYLISVHSYVVMTIWAASIFLRKVKYTQIEYSSWVASTIKFGFLW